MSTEQVSMNDIQNGNHTPLASTFAATLHRPKPTSTDRLNSGVSEVAPWSFITKERCSMNPLKIWFKYGSF